MRKREKEKSWEKNGRAIAESFCLQRDHVAKSILSRLDPRAMAPQLVLIAWAIRTRRNTVGMIVLPYTMSQTTISVKDRPNVSLQVKDRSALAVPVGGCSCG